MRTFIQASSRATSVPGRIGSHQSALEAAVEKRGSTTTSFPPRDSPAANAVICDVKAFSLRWLPTKTMSLDSSRSTGHKRAHKERIHAVSTGRASAAMPL
jgi:hypothetical protein